LTFGSDAPHGKLHVDPELPHWRPDLTVQNLHVGGRRFDTRSWREGDDTKFDVVDGDPEAVGRREFGAQFQQLRPAYRGRCPL